MMKITEISKTLKKDPADISRWLSGKRPVSWSFAAELSKLFPAKTTEQWKSATPDELRRAFAQLKDVA
jgi:hypothetical protein